MKKTYIVLSLVVLLGLTSCGTKVVEETPVEPTPETPVNWDLETNVETPMANELTGSVVLDLNHPLAGKALNFEVEMVEVIKAEGNTATDTVENGDSVKVHYTGTLDDGTVFDSSKERNQTLDFTVGTGQMIEGFDTGVIGMKKKETKTLNLAPEQAYGAYDETRRETVPKADLESFVAAGFKLEVGEMLPTQVGELKIIEVIE